jgi:hypothetical protein
MRRLQILLLAQALLPGLFLAGSRDRLQDSMRPIDVIPDFHAIAI